MEKNWEQFFGVYFFGAPNHSKSTKTSLDGALTILMLDVFSKRMIKPKLKT